MLFFVSNVLGRFDRHVIFSGDAAGLGVVGPPFHHHVVFGLDTHVAASGNIRTNGFARGG